MEKIEASKFLHIQGTDIFKVSGKQELVGLLNKYPVRLFFDGSICYVWKAEDLDHSQVEKELKNYANLTGVVGVVIEKNW